MADLFTVSEHRENYRELNYCWIGDGNNMANSWINAAAVFGFELRVATPVGYEPDAAVCKRAADAGAKIFYTNDPGEAAQGAQVLNTDVWASMGQEKEQQERAKAFIGYQINMDLIRLADPDWRLLTRSWKASTPSSTTKLRIACMCKKPLWQR
jgi:ornithine carbamoyltransferase